MRIAFLTTEYPSEPTYTGGLANYLGRTARGLLDLGHEPEVFVLAGEERVFDYEGVLVHRVRNRSMTAAWVAYLLDKVIRSEITLPERMLAASRALNRALRKRHREKPFDMVQGASYLGISFHAALQADPPVVIRVSSYEPLHAFHSDRKRHLGQGLLERLEISAIRKAKGVYAPSQLLANALLEREGIRAEVIEPPFFPDVSPEEEDPSFLRKEIGQEPYLLFYGTFSRLKGAGVLADALPEAFKECPDMRLVLVGQARQDRAVEAFRRIAASFPGRVQEIGPLRHAGLFPVIRAARAVVLPSLVDNLPNTALESMGLGKVVIGSRGASFDQLIEDGQSGILVTAGDAESLRDAMVRAWRMEEVERVRIGESARAIISRLHPDRALTRLLDFYESIRNPTA